MLSPLHQGRHWAQTYAEASSHGLIYQPMLSPSLDAQLWGLLHAWTPPGASNGVNTSSHNKQTQENSELSQKLVQLLKLKSLLRTNETVAIVKLSYTCVMKRGLSQGTNCGDHRDHALDLNQYLVPIIKWLLKGQYFENSWFQQGQIQDSL